ncbi:putative dimethylaniline monooxygenase [Hypoxylon rubiginosum]|uniref:Dimethylaniline monooxygenase n=1 Tax=Hypoxylon rubiginosum TaxID=110542 RepID=A0ACC0D1I3_9PEZI|nr:putative dimethylaniline monooxygenase [Hypoxylon rubiginosum]
MSAFAVPSMSKDGNDTTDQYIIPDTLLGYRRPIKVIVIGFGFSGINISYILNRQVKNSNISLQFYEKNPELGGTWFENRYPGCACDVPIVNYQYSWHPNPNWTSYYVTQKEILEYLHSAVSHHNLDSCVKLNHCVTSAWWEQDESRWKVRVQPHSDPNAAFFDYAEILINATGVLNNWKWPTIPGLEKFKNKVHSAAWDSSIVLTDKTVGVIGNGSSSVQILTAIYKKAKHISNFLRSPTWVTTGMAVRYAGEGGSNVKFSEEQKRNFAEKPEEYLAYRKAVEREMNSDFAILIKGTKKQLETTKLAKEEMLRKLEKRPELAGKLIPTDFAIGCRRPIPNNGYLEALISDKCYVTFSKIVEATENGLITEDGTMHKLDVLVCGTGFDVSFKPRFPIIGREGIDLRDAFRDSPETYLSTMAPDFPNYFMVVGPFGPYGHGSIIPAIEAITRHVALVLEKVQTQNIKSLVPKKEAVLEFKQHRELYLKRTIWDAPCSSWFKLGPHGENIMMWPGSRLHCFDILLNPRWEDYDWEYLTGNRFSYWGNGFTTVDAEEEEKDKAWYIAGI